MTHHDSRTCTAFAGECRIASGDIRSVARDVKSALDAGEDRTILIFDDASSQPVELDLRGDLDAVQARYRPVENLRASPERSVGRPKLGVVAREVTLLPRHWEWLSGQPGGASVALRKLVDGARKIGETQDGIRLSREAAFRFMSAMAGNLSGFEEAARALFAGDADRFDSLTAGWPADIRNHARRVAAVGLGRESPAQIDVGGPDHSRVSKPAVAGA